jgi:hypothetical protein
MLSGREPAICVDGICGLPWLPHKPLHGAKEMQTQLKVTTRTVLVVRIQRQRAPPSVAIRNAGLKDMLWLRQTTKVLLCSPSSNDPPRRSSYWSSCRGLFQIRVSCKVMFVTIKSRLCKQPSGVHSKRLHCCFVCIWLAMGVLEAQMSMHQQ